MPSSLPAAIQYVISEYEATLPTTILDIGIGWGKYGLLAREYLFASGSLKRLDGVEVWKPYIGPIQRAIYDHIYEVDVREFTPEIDYDLILIMDVIEHMKKDEGMEVYKRLLKRCKRMIISTPRGFKSQEAEFGNPYEVHRSGWLPTDFDPSVQELGNDYQFMLILNGGINQ